MKNFCTHCGHQNQADNKICVECGKPLADREVKHSRGGNAASPKKDRKPLSLKTKVLSIAGVLVLASLIGAYSWGTKTASADTAVSKFFEALKAEDPGKLAEQVVLSDGEKMTEKEAEAFIRMYSDVTPYELESMASVEKKGKFMGVFDAHKIILPVRKLSFDFPHKGLTLSLNGETVADSKNIEGQYTFANISPGLYDAEFEFEGEFAEFNYPFELAVTLQEDSAVAETIYEELPVSSVVFGLDTYIADDAKANKIIIQDTEIPVGEAGETEEVGPLLLDGSQTAQAEVNFPWGKQLSEPVKISSGYQTIGFTGLDEKQQTALIKQLSVFAEEYVEAYGTRDAAAFSTVTKNGLEIFKEDIAYMKDGENYFKGSLTEVGVDEESIQIYSDGQSVEVSAEFVIDGEYYYDYQSAPREMTEIIKEASLDFVFDEKEGKWLVEAYNEDMFMFDVMPTKTVEGSKKLHQITGNSTETEEVATETVDLDEETAEGFFTDYNNASVAAINSGDFSVVSDYVHSDGPRYNEQSGFIDDMYAKGVTEEHLSTSVEKVEALDDEFFKVTTVEEFIIHGSEKSDEKTYRTVTKVKVEQSGVTVYELISTTPI